MSNSKKASVQPKEEKLFTLKEAKQIWIEGGKASHNMFQGRDYVDFENLDVVINKTK